MLFKINQSDVNICFDTNLNNFILFFNFTPLFLLISLALHLTFTARNEMKCLEKSAIGMFTCQKIKRISRA